MGLKRLLLVQHIGGGLCIFVGCITAHFAKGIPTTDAGWILLGIVIPSIVFFFNFVMAATVIRLCDQKRWLLRNLVTVLFLLLLCVASGSSLSCGYILYRTDDTNMETRLIIQQSCTWVSAMLMLAMLAEYANLYLQAAVNFHDVTNSSSAAGGHNNSSRTLPRAATYSTFISSGSESVAAAMTTGQSGGGGALSVGKLGDVSLTGSDVTGPPSRRIPSSRSETLSRSYQQMEDDDSFAKDWRSARLPSNAVLAGDGSLRKGRAISAAAERKPKGTIKRQASSRLNFDGSSRNGSPPSVASKLLRPLSRSSGHQPFLTKGPFFG